MLLSPNIKRTWLEVRKYIQNTHFDLWVNNQSMSFTVPAEFTMLSDLAGCYKFADLCQFLIASYNSKSYLISRWSSISSCWNWKSKSVTQQNFHMKLQTIPEWICHVSHEGSHFRPQGASGTPRGPPGPWGPKFFFFLKLCQKVVLHHQKCKKIHFLWYWGSGHPGSPKNSNCTWQRKCLTFFILDSYLW